MDLILFPEHPLERGQPDPDFEAERNAAEECGFRTGLTERKNAPGRALYRGWMLKPAEYLELFQRLDAGGVRLINTPEEYRHCHHLPSTLPVLGDWTPTTVVVPADRLRERPYPLDVFGDRPLVLKDYVKSCKHYWHEACFVPRASDRTAVEAVVDRFLELRGSDLEGGLVFREYIELESIGRHSRSGMPLSLEYRLFYFKGELLATAAHWDEGIYPDLEVPLHLFVDLAGSVRSNFFTMDVARDRLGKWWVVELGDGQVAGLGPIAPADFYRRLAEVSEAWPGRGLRSLAANLIRTPESFRTPAC